jgi:hypothetical protein
MSSFTAKLGGSNKDVRYATELPLDGTFLQDMVKRSTTLDSSRLKARLRRYKRRVIEAWYDVEWHCTAQEMKHDSDGMDTCWRR